MQRKLAAILAADVVGYARLMSEHEVGTLAALKAHRDEGIEPKVTEHHGRIVKLMGDGLLAEFGGGVDAVESPQIHDSHNRIESSFAPSELP